MKKYLHELHKRKDLLLYLVTSGLKAQYRNSFLGYSWWLLDPLLGAMIYYFVVVRIFRHGDESYGLFLLIGMIVWRWLSATVTMASRSIVAQAGIITQVYLPKIIFPLSTVLTQLVNFGFGLLVIAVFAGFSHLKPSSAVIWLPYITLMQLCFLTAIAVAFSYVSVFVRDTEDLLGHVLPIWFLSSPVIWPENLLTEKTQWIAELNPMACFLAAYRDVFMHQASPDGWRLLVIGVTSVLGVMCMTYYFSQHEHKIIKAL
jgi:ABC-type polysaccharide/polyol phosphate export permease